MRSQGDLPVFLAFAGQARRRNEDHALALEAHPAHLIAADPGRIRRRVNPRDSFFPAKLMTISSRYHLSPRRGARRNAGKTRFHGRITGLALIWRLGCPAA
jgi:hypothetical protein